MKRAFLVILLLLSASPGFAGTETLNNDSVVSMVRAGLGEDAVIAKIRVSEGNYATTVQDLIALKKAKVPDRVIAAMIETTRSPPKNASTALSRDSRDPMIPHAAGVYLLTGEIADARMVAIDPINIQFRKSGVFLSYVLTGGLAPMSNSATIPGIHARLSTQKTRPIFYFFFEDNLGDGRANFWVSNNVTTSSEFALIQLDAKSGMRTKKIGKFNIMGSSFGVNDKDRIPFTSSEIRPGVFEVIPVHNLPVGEYAFVYSPFGATKRDMQEGLSGFNKMFDFSIASASVH